MTRLTLFVALLASIYGGYWFYGSSAVNDSATAAIEDLRQDGWDITYGGLDTQGFPNRFDTSLTDFSITEPSTGLTWAAPIVEMLALSYIPDRAIIAFAPSQTFTLPNGEVLTFASDGLRASLAYQLAGGFALEAMTAEVGQVTVISDAGWRASSTRSLVAQRVVEGTTNQHDLWFETEALSLPADLRAMLDPDNTLPDTLALVRADSRVTLAGGETSPEALTLRDWRVTWGGINVEMTGDLTPDADGLAQGALTIKALGWPQLIDVLGRAGMISPQMQPMVRGAIGALANGQDSVEIPLTLAEGRMSIGPFPVGAAPRLR